MIRQNKDGRPIYSDRTWAQIVEIGQKLIKLGYVESYKKPNLFYKSIKVEIKDDQGKIVEGKGVIFADLRGTEIVPIWDDPSPLIYQEDLPFNIFLPEFIILNRAGCSPRVSFYDECEPDGWMFGLDDIPTGYCKRCGDDILSTVDWDILKKDFIDLYDQGIDQNLEVGYCETCRKIEYNMREYRLQYAQQFNKCELCGIKDAQNHHHITYVPEKIVRVCKSCHGKIHRKGFPNPLWKERKNHDSIPAKPIERELVVSSTQQEKEHIFHFDEENDVQKPFEGKESIESLESAQVVEHVETKYDFTKNANYIENLIYESETSGAVRFGRQKDDSVLWIPNSIIKDGWDKDTPNEQTTYLTFVPQKNFGWQERNKK